MVDGQLAIGPRMRLDRLRNAVQRSDRRGRLMWDCGCVRTSMESVARRLI